MQRQRSVSTLKASLKRVFNRYIRIRDIKNGCISCRKHVAFGGAWHAGHYNPVSETYAALEFNERNVNGQCNFCNTFLGGNPDGYREGLEKKHGKEVFNELRIVNMNKTRWTHWEYMSLIKYYKQKLKKIEGDQIL